jgi:hypothetical protein
LTYQNAKTAFSREALTAGTSAHTTFGETPEASRNYKRCCRSETRLSESILPKMTYAHADTNVLLTIQHTLYQPKGGRKEKASITFFFPHQLFAA